MASPRDSPALGASTEASPMYLSPGVAAVGVPAGGSALTAPADEVAVAATSSAKEPEVEPWAGDKVALTGCHPPVVPLNSVCAGVRRFDSGGTVVAVVLVVVVGGDVAVGGDAVG